MHAREAPHGMGREGRQEARGLEGPICTTALTSQMLGVGLWDSRPRSLISRLYPSRTSYLAKSQTG